MSDDNTETMCALLFEFDECALYDATRVIADRDAILRARPTPGDAA